jgi:hypothetical protein
MLLSVISIIINPSSHSIIAIGAGMLVICVAAAAVAAAAKHLIVGMVPFETAERF